MSDLANYIRIFATDPTDELVEKRKTAIKNLMAKFKKRSKVNEILQLANDLAIAIHNDMPQNLVMEIEAAIQKESSSFIKDEQEIQILVCGLVAAIQILQTSKPGVELSVEDVLAIGLWSSLSFQLAKPDIKLESLRAAVLSEAHKLVINRASAGRKRVIVPEFDVTQNIKDLSEVSNYIKSAAAVTINALRSNAALDREELDLLWWITSNWSHLFGQKISSMTQVNAVIASGIEIGELLRKLPHDSHKHLVLRVIDSDEPINLIQLLDNLGDDRDKLASAYKGKSQISACPEIFPLLTAIIRGEASGAAAELSRPLSEWGARALLEIAILHLTVRAGI